MANKGDVKAVRVTATGAVFAGRTRLRGLILVSDAGGSAGGLAGSIITCKAIGANRWGVQVNTGGTGDAATPFSAAVS